MNFYAHHIGDYARDTAHLTFLEDAAYRRMLDLYYASERALSAEKNVLYRVLRARTKEEKSAVDTVLAEFFSLADDGWHQVRCDAEMARMQEKSGKAKASAAKRWQCERISPEDANAMRTHSEGNAPITHKPLPNTQVNTPPASRTAPARRRSKVPIPPDFDISDRVRAWASEKGFDRLDEHCEAFRRKAAANGYAYADWDAAFMEAVREDWAKLRGGGRVNGSPVLAPPPVADGKIACRSCGQRVTSHINFQCDACYRQAQPQSMCQVGNKK